MRNPVCPEAEPITPMTTASHLEGVISYRLLEQQGLPVGGWAHAGWLARAVVTSGSWRVGEDYDT